MHDLSGFYLQHLLFLRFVKENLKNADLPVPFSAACLEPASLSIGYSWKTGCPELYED
jgi:hypothetical protein